MCKLLITLCFTDPTVNSCFFAFSINPHDDTDLVSRLSPLVVWYIRYAIICVYKEKIIPQMQSVIVRSFFKLRRFRRFYNSTHRCLALSAAKTTINAVQSVYMNEYECLVLKWNNGRVDEYPYVYLRENCRCSTC